MSLIYVMSCHQIQLCAREHSPIHSTVRFKIRGRSTVLPIVPRGNMVCTARLRRESRGHPTFKGSSCGSSVNVVVELRWIRSDADGSAQVNKEER
jgi:hypothetical protein